MNIVDNFFEKINKLPMLPKVVQEVTTLLKDSEVDIKELAHKIDHDQALSARVLRMSNSAYFGCSRTIRNIEDAVAVIGLKNLSTLVIASGVTKAFTEIPGIDLQRFWAHSLMVASIARELGKEVGLEPETAYIGGLMHSVGQLPIYMVFPAAGVEIEAASSGRNVMERKSLEYTMLGITHCEVGEMLARHWNFPEVILRVIRYYSEPFSENACNLAPIVYAAVHIAYHLEQDVEAQTVAETLNSNVLAALKFKDVQTLSEKIETYRAFVEEAHSYV
jgi:HD-like signal output (HDOD) protein